MPRHREVTTYSAIVGQVIATRRRDVGVTQNQIAEHLGVGQSAWSKLERGVSPITVEQLRTIGSLLRQDPGEVLGIADQIAKRAERRGIRVEAIRGEGTVPAELVLLGGTALGALVATVVHQLVKRGGPKSKT